MMQKKLAMVVSRVFDPVIEIPFLLSAAVWFVLSNGFRWRFMVLLLMVDAILPAMYFLYNLKKGYISDWDTTKRQERLGLYFFTILCHLFGVVLAYFLGREALFKILFVFWTLAVIFGLVTLFWKISVHAGVNGVLVAFFNYFYGWDKYWWLVLVLLLVLWSRVISKKHTWLQVGVGAALGLSLVSLGLKWV